MSSGHEKAISPAAGPGVKGWGLGRVFISTPACFLRGLGQSWRDAVGGWGGVDTGSPERSPNCRDEGDVGQHRICTGAEAQGKGERWSRPPSKTASEVMSSLAGHRGRGDPGRVKQNSLALSPFGNPTHTDLHPQGHVLSWQPLRLASGSPASRRGYKDTRTQRG